MYINIEVQLLVINQIDNNSCERHFCKTIFNKSFHLRRLPRRITHYFNNDYNIKTVQLDVV